MSEIAIRKATAEDAEILLQYLKQVGGESDNLSMGPEGALYTIEQEREFLASIAKKETSVHYSAYDGSILVGNASLSGKTRRTSHRASLGITVIKDYWNKGVGSKLMQEIVNYAKLHSIEFIDLTVRSDNLPAIHLYEKFGFKKTGVIPGCMKIGSDYIDCNTMSLDLR